MRHGNGVLERRHPAPAHSPEPGKDTPMNDWPYEFPGAYWLGEEEESAALDVLRNGSLFRYYGLREPKYAAAYDVTKRT